MPEKGGASGIDQPWTDLQSQLPGYSRNSLAALLLDALFGHLALFDEQGFAPFRGDWEHRDGLKGQAISVYGGGGPFHGVAAGIDERGALILETDAETLTLHSGEVSLSKTKI
jgi:BirA family biotin operon repressor/biotin-[acetyl-CoA-carboxylase] ligase